jgi:hypothetical protein
MSGSFPTRTTRSKRQSNRSYTTTARSPKNQYDYVYRSETWPDIATDPRPEPEPKHDGLTTPEQTENKRIPVPEHVEPEQPKRGWLSRFFLPNG